ncbi:hypothetical protein AAG565_04950 [Fontimonas sp. SYSU GA230001]|uniref:hypothetical protein n=1 Tax=Fontimonas sp. SYSU GA230001 TaxID=3142450 RepID=UPI0032B401C9
MRPPLTALAAAVLLTACGGVSRHCVGEFEYQRAQTLPVPAQVDGLAVRDSPSALQIPPPPAHPVPFAREVEDPKKPGKMRTECLDVPPPLNLKAEPPAPDAAKPAPDQS